jgi:outer membrane protein OmpA-like peptidoglycan-associated protein
LNALSPENRRIVDTLPKVVINEKQAVPKDLVIYFAFDKSEFNVNDQTRKYFDESNKYLKQNVKVMLTITGHTDAIGTKEYNQALGYRRAQSVKQYFEREGISAKKISIESKGELQPVDNNSTQKGRANNRRTVITLKK